MKTLYILTLAILMTTSVIGISKVYAQYGDGFSPIEHYPQTNDTQMKLAVMNSTEFKEKTTGYTYAFAGLDYNWISLGNNNHDFGGAKVTYFVTGFENGTTRGDVFNIDSKMNVTNVFEYDADSPPAGYIFTTCYGCLLSTLSQTDIDKYHIGHVEDGTYNETAAIQLSTQLLSMQDEKISEKQKLEDQLTAIQNDYDNAIKDSNATKISSLLGDINTIKNQTSDLQNQIDKITQEFNVIQEENILYYYMDPVLLKKYQAAADGLVTKIQAQYWMGKSFDEQQKAFPLVEASVDSKEKSVVITLQKDIENSTSVDQYISVIKGLMPSDVPWYISYGEPTTGFPILSTIHPLQQSKSGINPQDITCNQGLQLVIKSEDNSPACVKESSIDRLARQGWWVWNDKVGDTIVNTSGKKDFDSKTCGLTDTVSSIVGTNGFVKDDLPKDGTTYPGINFTASVGHAIQFSIEPNSEGYIIFTYDFNQYPGNTCKVTTKDVIAATNPSNPDVPISELIGSPDILKVNQNSVDIGSTPLGNSGDITLSLSSAKDLNDHVVKAIYKISTKPDAQIGKSYYIGFWWHSSVVVTVGDSLYNGTAFSGPRFG